MTNCCIGICQMGYTWKVFLFLSSWTNCFGPWTTDQKAVVEAAAAPSDLKMETKVLFCWSTPLFGEVLIGMLFDQAIGAFRMSLQLQGVPWPPCNWLSRVFFFFWDPQFVLLNLPLGLVVGVRSQRLFLEWSSSSSSLCFDCRVEIHPFVVFCACWRKIRSRVFLVLFEDRFDFLVLCRPWDAG